GVKPASTQRMFMQGSLQNTNNKPDLAIEGEGFFRVQLYDGTLAYTRDGAWKIDSNRQMVNHSGYRMDPEIIFPENYLIDTVAISKDGLVTCKVGGSDEIIEVGQMELYRFVNPAGLTSIGGNLYKVSEASGSEIAGIPGYEGMGQLHQGFIEMSNVQVVEEMVAMIVAQRAYDLNSKSIQTSDAMLGTAVNLKR
ncbi:MAG: flagellar hook-basal body complex protein, partial [Spirochaetes bacterium]|nr:flagellar hook-basal body complex protein [Spirochaetota bacterium]